jgi:FKBP-type peptidyl-prolyl cis-trans isomerase FklB
MKIALKTIMAAGLGVALAYTPARAAEGAAAAPATPATPAAPDLGGFKDQREKASYSIGLYFGNQIKSSGMDLDLDVVAGGIKDVLGGKEVKLNEQQARETIQAYRMESMKKAGEKNRKAGEEFLAQNKTKDGVKVLPVTMPDGTTAELQYKILTDGTGPIPKDTDTVSVNYRGTTIDGKEFANSARGNAPAKIPVRGMFLGWTKAVEMMKVGSKWQVFLPAVLGFGDNPRPNVEPGSTLVVDVELLGIEAPPQAVAPAMPATPAQPLTSDIIKVPSAEELKRGAKVEVLKAEDVERQIREEAAKAAALSNKPAQK